MNVVNLENSLAPPGAQGRGRGRGRGRDLATGSLAANNPNIKSFPKYGKFVRCTPSTTSCNYFVRSAEKFIPRNQNRSTAAREPRSND